MSPVLQSIDQFTPAWLTNTLHERGNLLAGEVITILETGRSDQFSLNYFLTIDYSDDAPSSAPRKLFLKLMRPERLPMPDSEVMYYTQVGAAMPNPPLPRCYSAEHDSECGAYHILLEDVSATHGMHTFPILPKWRHIELMIDSMAEFHAFWWEHARLDGDIAYRPTEAVIRRYVEHCRGGLQPLIDFMEDRLPPHQRDILKRVFDKHPDKMISRSAQGDITFIHGDSHAGNFLLPHGEGRALLIDRQPFDWSLTSWLGVSDLAYMIVHWWFPERRRALEKRVLDYYHQRLQSLGITHYSKERLWLDYRLCAMQSLYVAIEWLREDEGGWAYVWYLELQNALTAFEDLQCGELL